MQCYQLNSQWRQILSFCLVEDTIHSSTEPTGGRDMARVRHRARLEGEEEQFITSGNWRGKRNSLSRGAGAHPPRRRGGDPRRLESRVLKGEPSDNRGEDWHSRAGGRPFFIRVASPPSGGLEFLGRGGTPSRYRQIGGRVATSMGSRR